MPELRDNMVQSCQGLLRRGIQSGSPVHLNAIPSPIFLRTAHELQTQIIYSFQVLPKCCDYIVSMRCDCTEVRPYFLHYNSKNSVFKSHLFPEGEKIHLQDCCPMHQLCSILINTIQQLRVTVLHRTGGNGQIHQ